MNRYQVVQLIIVVTIYVLMMFVFPYSTREESPLISSFFIGIGLFFPIAGAVVWSIVWLQVKSNKMPK